MLDGISNNVAALQPPAETVSECEHRMPTFLAAAIKDLAKISQDIEASTTNIL